MPVRAEPELIERLRRSDLLTPEQWDQFISGDDEFESPQAFADALVSRKWLTRFQAEHFVRGELELLELGGYRLLEPIGTGGQGEVFRALQVKLNREVALKRLRAESSEDSEALRRLLREAKAVARLSHPNIVHVYDWNEDHASPFLVMEFVRGISLSEMVHERGPLLISVACEYIRQAALGLEHAHQNGLIHRDIKPSNLLVADAPTGSHANSNNYGVVKILDLGLARMVKAESTDPALTRFQAVLGTPDYMSPEQAHDSSNVDHRADLYSLGCTFYFLLAGHPPYPTGTSLEKILKHQIERPKLITETRRGIPAGVLSILGRLMRKSPRDRYQKAVDVAEALRDFLENSPKPGSGPLSVEAPMSSKPKTTVLEGDDLEKPATVVLPPLVNRHRQMEPARHPIAVGDALFSAEAPSERPAEEAVGNTMNLRPNPLNSFPSVSLLLRGSSNRNAVSSSETPSPTLVPTRPSEIPGLTPIPPPPPPSPLRTSAVPGLIPVSQDSIPVPLRTSAVPGLTPVSQASIPVPLRSSAVPGLTPVPPPPPPTPLRSSAIPGLRPVPPTSQSVILRRSPAPTITAPPPMPLKSDTGSTFQVVKAPTVSTSFPKSEALSAIPAHRVSVLQGHSTQVVTMAFSPKGQFLTTAGLDNAVRIWRIDGPDTRQEIAFCDSRLEEIRAVAYAPHGGLLVSASGMGSRIWHWQWRDGESAEFEALEGSMCATIMSVSPDGKYLAAANGNQIGMWAVTQDGFKPRRPIAIGSEVTSLAFSSDGQRLLIGQATGEVQIWADGWRGFRESSSFVAHKGAVSSIAVSHNDRTIATAGTDNMIRFWSRLSGAELQCQVPTGGQGVIRILQFASRNDTLAAVGGSGRVTFLRSSDGQIDMDWRLNPTVSPSFAIADHLELAAASRTDGTVCLYQLTNRLSDTVDESLTKKKSAAIEGPRR